MRWRMNTLRGGKALCRLCGAFTGWRGFRAAGDCLIRQPECLLWQVRASP
jgi:hypothetical protein